MSTTFVSINELSDRLGVPAKWLKEEALHGRIPHILVNDRPRFNIASVERVLLDTAAKGTSGGAPASDADLSEAG